MRHGSPCFTLWIRLDTHRDERGVIHVNFGVCEIAHHFGIDDERLHALGYG
ncbi:metallopeptidase family protein [Streptomyces sp. NPDC059805]|uniref:metallopeptidase family protein n=1 Tax=Streptomyces sp. NPDC059805 TaxID=3346954 RepID=UPI0036631D34